MNARRDETIDEEVADDLSDRDRLLFELLEDLTARRRAGGEPDLGAATAAHPHLAAELRELWSAVLIAERLAGETSGDYEAGAPLPPDPPRLVLPVDFGEYRLVEELGRGGMGVVYKAEQASLARTVAVKMLLGGDHASATEQARFHAESQSAGRLDHPHIVPVFEVGRQAGQPYFCMKYIQGTTLARRLADGPLEPRQAARILATVARAVQHAHEHGVLHRDLKPSNILVDGAGQPHVSDFGLAKRIDVEGSLTRSGAVLGTPSYLAPEQAGGARGEITPATDVYSLGAVLYAMLTGRPPFQAATPVDTVLMVLEQDPPAPRVLNPRADRDLEMIALKCLQKPRELRYAAAADLAADLESYLAGEPVAARSGAFSQVVGRLFRETHHAAVLENWGLLWIWHSLALLVICLLTNAMQWGGVESPGPYLALWTAGLGAWAAIFWTLRRRAGPVTFVERQIAHLWAGSMMSIVGLFVVEVLLGLPVLTLSPVIALTSAMVFVAKAGVLSGAFYLQAGALLITAGAMALLQRWNIPLGVSLFGLVSAACFFLPGLKYHRQRTSRR